MRTPVYTRQFEKDVKRMQRRGKKLEKLKRIVEVHMLFGEYDIIVKTNARNYTDLGRFVLKEIRPIRGVLDTETLTGVEFL